jgi:hypothetical protein
MKHLIKIIALLIIGCQDQTSQERTKDSNLLETHKNMAKKSTESYQPDSMELAYMDGKYFFKSQIRLASKDGAFIFIDSAYVTSFIKNKHIRDLYFNTKTLTQENRESFYRQIIKGIPKEDLVIHKIVWDIKEIQAHKIDSKIGYHSVVSIVKRPNKESDEYLVSIKRDYYNRLGACFPIRFLSINAKNHKIMVEEDGEYYPLEKWREMQ